MQSGFRTPDGDRMQGIREMLENLRRTTVRGGLLGDFRFDRYGDTTQTTIAIYHIADGQLWYSRSIEVPARLLTRR